MDKTTILNRWMCLTVMIALLSGCAEDFKVKDPPASITLSGSLYYEVELKESDVDKFRVKVYLDGMPSEIFQFAAAVPGTYRMSDFGRYVTDFKAYNHHSSRLKVENIATNQWQIENPEKVYYIEYTIEETWGNEREGQVVYPMSGTGVGTNHALLNFFGILGYPLGAEEYDYLLTMTYPEDWKVATSMQSGANGPYHAEGYHNMVDDPAILGNISSHQFLVDGKSIGVYATLEGGFMNVDHVNAAVESVMFDAKGFLKELPVDYYNFLFLFQNIHAGALEHLHSSVYVLKDAELSDAYKSVLQGIIAHEFFHTITPLGARSEMIDDFDYANPIASRHLWLYEGVTEWASDMMLYRGETWPLEELLNQQVIKYRNYLNGNPKVSLLESSELAFTTEGVASFPSVYYRGSLVALLMDIHLLEWSKGTFGLRELMLELNKLYFPGNPFKDEELFDILVAQSYPQLESFIESYIIGNEDLPVPETLLKVGIEYDSLQTFSVLPEKDSAQQAMFQVWSKNL